MILSDLIKSYTVQNKTTYRKLAKEIGVPFIKGKIMKDVRLPLSIAGDGEMIQWVCQHHKATFVPDLFVWFNYLEPGRWTPTSSTPP